MGVEQARDTQGGGFGVLTHFVKSVYLPHPRFGKMTEC